MASLADKAILSGADNRPPMLEKDMYDSWKSRMELYMLNRPHGRMILESVEQGPLIWPSVEVEGVTRLKNIRNYLLLKLFKLTVMLRLPISFCKDSLQRFSLLLNDMNMYNMKLEQFQVNTKFLNTLPSEWSKFVTDVKLVLDLHTINVDQLHAYLGQHEYHANEVRLMNERTSDPLALISQHQLNRTPYPHHQQMYQKSQFQPQATSYQSSPYGPTYHNSQFVSSGPSSLTHSISYPGTDTSSLVNHMHIWHLPQLLRGTDLVTGADLESGTDLVTGADLESGTDLVTGADLEVGTDLEAGTDLVTLSGPDLSFCQEPI
nr:hypothetical protein [Tanacetum cinerariifolium]